MPVLAVPKPAAEEARRRVLRADLFDPDRQVAERGDRIEIPVRERPPAELIRAVEGRVREGSAPRRTWFRDPTVRIRRRLEPVLGDRVELLPGGYDRLGDVVLVRLPDALRSDAEAIGRVYAEELGARSVLALSGIEGELREPGAERIFGDADTRTVHREHGLLWELDPARVMFSSGNQAERRRILDRDLEGRTVVDLFAGVGQFTVPAASAGARVVALEKNRVAAGFLEANVKRNSVRGRVEVRRGDCREVAPAGVADVVLMGLLPDARPFLPTARRALDGPGRVVLHEVVDVDVRPEAPPGTRLVETRTVKPYGPGREHVVLELEVRA